MTSVLVAVPVAGNLVLEPRFGRWHASATCPVLVAQPEAFVQPVHDPGATRACTICALPAHFEASP